MGQVDRTGGIRRRSRARQRHDLWRDPRLLASGSTCERVELRHPGRVVRRADGGASRPVAVALPEGSPMTASIVLRSVSKWSGNVVAVNDVSLEVHPGITGPRAERRREDNRAAYDGRACRRFGGRDRGARPAGVRQPGDIPGARDDVRARGGICLLSRPAVRAACRPAPRPRRRRGRGGQGVRVRGALGRTEPCPRHVLPGNEAAHEAGCR